MSTGVPPRWKSQLAAMSADDQVDERTKPKRPRRRVTRDTRVPSEEAEHLELAFWLDNRDLLWCHCPNGELRHPRTAHRLRAMGVKAGVPDILIFSRPPLYQLARGVAIELKRVNVRRPTVAQAAWLAELGTQGWCVQVCSGAKAAIEWLRSLGF